MTHSALQSDAQFFMRSEEGRALLGSIQNHLQGRTIHNVTFEATESGVATVLHLDKNQTYTFMDEELLLDTLYDQHSRMFMNECNKQEDP